MAASAAATVNIKSVKICPVKSFKNIEKDTKFILTDNKNVSLELKKMTYDGRLPDIPWRNQNINTLGYHYYMTPETAHKGLNKLPTAIAEKPKQWVLTDWPDLTQMDIFN